MIPVCFKRKLSYTGSYIEEYVEKEKIKMYFAWFKKFNHLFKNIELDSNLIEEFESESVDASCEFENSTKEEGFVDKSDDEEDQIIDELSDIYFKGNKIEPHEPIKPEENDWTHNQTTMFLNKYSENTNIASVSNKMADMIVDYETDRGIQVENEDDFEVDDEIITEEEFLLHIDAELDEKQAAEKIVQIEPNQRPKIKETSMNLPQDQSAESQDIDIVEPLQDVSASHKTVEDEFISDLDMMYNPSVEQAAALSKKAHQQASNILNKMEKICVAPGEQGGFKNWGDDIFLEEKCFPEKFPFGTGGYLSSCINDPKHDMGFANYCVNQILSCDQKFRNDSSYLFFLLLVKELIQIKRCKSTYFRQATRLPTLTKQDVCNFDRSNLNRFNRSFQVFKSLRGTSMYYEESKKNLMALLRQNGCPSVFLTLSCAEFDWPELLKEIAETVYRRKFSNKQIEELTNKEKNKLISENVVQSTLHFQKRIEKMFTLMGFNFFEKGEDSYHVASYFFRVEFQQRGAPHVHSLLWLKDKENKEAPNFWVDSEDENEDMSLQNKDQNRLRMKRIEQFADLLISTSSDEMFCEKHEIENNQEEDQLDCDQCNFLREKVNKYQKHNHTFTCAKKKKTITIKEHEGHGRLDGLIKDQELTDIPVCRFKFPKFPLDETKLILGISKDTEETIVQQRKNDLNRIIKFLIRQTQSDKTVNESPRWTKLKKMDFWEFLYSTGMFSQDKLMQKYTKNEKQVAKQRYLDALSASVQGTALVFMKRKVKDVFLNGYSKKIMRLFKANHDLQICIDQYSCAQYICGYLTKNESGMSKLLKAVNEEASNLKQIDKLNALASVLDKHREVSIQEAIYRLLGLPMIKSSVKVKYLSTIHPNFRDGLLKGNIENLTEKESIFHNSPHQYYENRPDQSIDQDKIQYDEEELAEDYWENLCLAKFWSRYEIVYGKIPTLKKDGKTKIIPLRNKVGYIRRRSELAVLRYYLNYSNDEDLARGLLILFMPFRNELNEIHTKDVKQLLDENDELIEQNRSIFEKYKLMSDLISTIQPEKEENETSKEDKGEEAAEIETTSLEDIEEFNKWAKSQASKDLSQFKNLTNVCDVAVLRSNISSLNYQQRRLFDDFTERCVSTDIDEKPVYLFLSGNAGTGKSFLVKLLVEAVKLIKIKSGDDLKKPPVIVMAPTANAAFIIGGKTIDSVLGFLPIDGNRYTQASPGKMAMMKFQFEDVSVIFCDEISMVGSMKLLKINYRLQDLVDENQCQEYMGGISFVASGDLWQLPPIYDVMVTDNNHLDGRPDFSPSHWNENFKIFYLTEKMRSQKDPFFSDLCDRVGRGKLTEEDEKYLSSRVKFNDSENDNDNFKSGKLSIIVTTNGKKDLINHQKLSLLLPHKKEYTCNSLDRVTNLPVGNKLPDKLKDNPGKTGNLQTELKIKIGAPILITSNHSKQKYREDGIVNGARGFVHSIQVNENDSEKVEVIWIVFNKESVGRLYRFEHKHLRQNFNPGHERATPMLPVRRTSK